MKSKIPMLFLCSCFYYIGSTAQPVQHYYDNETATFYDKYPKPTYVSLEEMKQAYEQSSQEKWMKDKPHFIGFYSRDGRTCTTAFEPNVFKNCPFIKNVPFRARFIEVKVNPSDEKSKSELALRYVTLDNGKDFSLTEMKRKYGVTVPNEKRDYAGGDVRVPWLDGTYMTLDYPLPYMGFVVSENRHVSHFDKGHLTSWGVSDSFNSCFKTFERSSSFTISLDGPWYNKTDHVMRLFSYESRHYMPQENSSKGNNGIRFDLILTIDQQGHLGVEVLRPKELSKEASREIEHLKDSMSKLPAWSLSPLYTLDNRILPGRYVQALYAHDHWIFEDYLQQVIPH